MGLFLSWIALSEARAVNWTYTVTNATDGGAGSLRQALVNIATFPAGVDGFVIGFNLAPPCRLVITGALPYIAASGDRPVLVDGTTQPGYVGTPLVELNGALVPSAGGLGIKSTASAVRGLRVVGFTNSVGVMLVGTSNRVSGCWIMSNHTGVVVDDGADYAVVGGTAASNRNVISTNAGKGLALRHALRPLVQGNYIGVTPDGAGDLGNGGEGVYCYADTATIGGTNAGTRNVIAGNGGSGIILDLASNVVVQGNFIGIGAAGTSAIRNAGSGIVCTGGGAMLGGTSTNARNVISGNGSWGISLVTPPGYAGSTVAANYIGTDASGMIAVSNWLGGIQSIGRSNVLGGVTAAQGNIIAGNGGYGILLDQNSNAYTTVEYNWIGLGASGLPLSNGTGIQSGLQINSHQNLIALNVISGQAGSGIHIVDGDNNLVAGNLIGLDPTGTAARPNFRSGVAITGDACSNLVGSALLRNVISGNHMTNFVDVAAGVAIIGTKAVSNVVFNNYIGTDKTGRVPLGNVGPGISVEDAADSQLRDNLVAACTQGILILGTNATDTMVDGNLIGADSSGTNSLGNSGYGIWIRGGSGHRIGTGKRNVVAGNGDDGLNVSGPVSNLVVAGNYFGLATNGTTRLGNAGDGITLINVVGEDLFFTNNTIAGNSGGGFNLMNSAVTNCVLTGNLIGLNAAGNAVVSNASAGVKVYFSSNVRIGGPTVAERNVIAGNGATAQINFDHANSNGASVVAGNYIGLLASGAALPAAAQDGISAFASPRVQAGGASAAWRNVIGGLQTGIANVDGPDWWIANNYIGTDPGASATRANLFGIALMGASHSNVVENNIVAGNSQFGVSLDSGPRGATIRANRIGLGVAGALPNGGTGLRLADVTACLVGGYTAVDGNRIAFNGGAGITVQGTGIVNNVLLANLIYSNAMPGIDLAGDGVTPNDSAPDADGGPNGRQNYPTLTFASAGGTNIAGQFTGAPGLLRLEFFALTPAAGAVLLGATNHYSPASGVASFSFAFPSNAPAGSKIVATATSVDGTSEFSPPIALSTAGDTDGDQMPDWWESAYGLNPAVSNAPASDADGDGISDRSEWIADTMPNDSNSYLRIVGLSGAPLSTLVVPSSGLRRYNLETAGAPSDTAWNVALTNVPGTGGLLSLADANGATQRTYRVTVHMP